MQANIWVRGVACAALALSLPNCSGSVDSDSGVSGTGGNAGAAGTAGTAGAAGAADCTGTQPAAMVQLPEGYSIDATEVSRCQYQAWLDTEPTTSGQDAWCAWNTDFTPTCEWPPETSGNLPVMCVDWCDAFAYCKGVGKRLCGKIGGDPNGFGDFADATKSQWYNACSSGGKYDYPYGDTYDNGQWCNDADHDTVKYFVAVGSLPHCQSSETGYSGVFDLSGNLWEWEDSCEASTGAADRCRMRGGSNLSPIGYASCGMDIAVERNERDNIGIRCCSP